MFLSLVKNSDWASLFIVLHVFPQQSGHLILFSYLARSYPIVNGLTNLNDVFLSDSCSPTFFLYNSVEITSQISLFETRSSNSQTSLTSFDIYFLPYLDFNCSIVGLLSLCMFWGCFMFSLNIWHSPITTVSTLRKYVTYPNVFD